MTHTSKHAPNETVKHTAKTFLENIHIKLKILDGTIHFWGDHAVCQVHLVHNVSYILLNMNNLKCEWYLIVAMFVSGFLNYCSDWVVVHVCVLFGNVVILIMCCLVHIAGHVLLNLINYLWDLCSTVAKSWFFGQPFFKSSRIS